MTGVIEVLSAELASTFGCIQQFNLILGIDVAVYFLSGRVLATNADIAVPKHCHPTPNPFAVSGIPAIGVPGILGNLKLANLRLVGK